MKLSYAKGLSFGIASGIVTTLGLMVGLYSGTHSKLAVLGGIVTIAIADAMSDAFGIHLSEESEKRNNNIVVRETMLATFLTKFIFALTFAVPVLFFDLKTAVFIGILWGLLLITAISVMIARLRKESSLMQIGEHVGIALAVIIITYYLGIFVSRTFGA